MTNKKPVNIQQEREKRSIEIEAELAEAAAHLAESEAEMDAAEQETEEGVADPAEAEAFQTEVQKLAGVQISIEEMFGIIGAQEYELRALRQRVQTLAQQVVTLKGVVKNQEEAARKKK